MHAGPAGRIIRGNGDQIMLMRVGFGSAAHHQHADGTGADRRAEQLRGGFHLGREHAGGRALEGPSRRPGNRDGARAVVGGRTPVWEDGDRPARRLDWSEIGSLTLLDNRAEAAPLSLSG